MPVINIKKDCLNFDNKIFADYSGNLIIVQQNIRSMRSNFDIFALSLESLDTFPDIIILSEIWILDNELNQYSLPNYNLFTKCNNSYRSGGVAVFVSDRLACHVIPDLDFETADCLHLSIIVSHKFTLDVLAIYRLQDFVVDRFVNELESCLSSIKNNNLVISGDLNINILERNRLNDDYLITIASYGLLSLISDPTRVTENSDSCIDHIFFRSERKLNIECASFVIDTGITDHRMTATCMKVNLPTRKANLVSQKEEIDFNKLALKLQSVSWDSVYLAKNVSLAFSLFMSIFKQCINESYVTKRISRNKNDKFKPWINTRLLKIINRKNKMHIQCKKQPHDVELKNNYNVFKNYVINQVRLTKNEYYSKILVENNQNPKKQWNTIKTLIGENRKDAELIVLKGDDKELITSPEAVANKLNRFFCSIATELRESIILEQQIVPQLVNEYKPMFQTTTCNNSIFFYPTCENEVIGIIKSLKNRKAPGYDNITPLIIKKISTYIVEVLVFLINFSLYSGEFPNDLKNSYCKTVIQKGCSNRSK